MIFLVTRSLADGIRLFATALVIAVVTQVPVPWTSSLLGAAMIVYTVRGGVSAVIWTDVVQMFVYIAGALVVFFALLMRIPTGGGRSRAAGGPPASSRCSTLSIRAGLHVLGGLVGGVALTLATHGTDQFLVQRPALGASRPGAAAGLVLSGFIVFAQFALFLVIGVMLFHVLPARRCRSRWAAPTRSCRCSSSPRSPRRVGLHRRGDRRRGAVAVV